MKIYIVSSSKNKFLLLNNIREKFLINIVRRYDVSRI